MTHDEAIYICGTVLYTLVVALQGLRLMPDNCVFDTSSAYSAVRNAVEMLCKEKLLNLQTFRYWEAHDSSGKLFYGFYYICCKTKRYYPDELAYGAKYIFVKGEGNRCLEWREMIYQCYKNTDWNNSSYPVIWDRHNGTCADHQVGARAYLCAKIPFVAECVYNEERCEILIWGTNECLIPSQIRRIAYDDCTKSGKRIASFNLTKYCNPSNEGNDIRGYKKIIYACCKPTSTIKDTKTEHATKEEEGLDTLKHLCSSDGFLIHGGKTCSCSERSKKDISVCCIPRDTCRHIRSESFPNDYYFNETLWVGTNKTYTIDCFRGTLVRNCTKAVVGAVWGAEVNNECETSEMVNTCRTIPSEFFPRDYHFSEKLYEGIDVTYTVHCHKGTLARVCSKIDDQATWGNEVNNRCKTVTMVTNDICRKIPSDTYPDDYFFNETIYDGTDVTIRIDCHTGTLKRTCTKDGIQAMWGIESNNLCKTIDMVVNEAKNDTEEGKLVSRQKVEEIVAIIDGVVNEAVRNTVLAKKMLSVVGNLMRLSQKMLLEAEKENEGQRLVSLVENFSSKLTISDGISNVVATKHVTVGAYKIDRLNTSLVVESYFHDYDAVGKTRKIDGPHVIIHSDILEKIQEKNDEIQIISYENPKLFLNSKSMKYMFDNLYSVVTIILQHSTAFENDQTVVIYKIPIQKDDSRNFACVFWDTKEENWSTNGISLIMDDDGVKVCRSTHLSSFFILMDTDTDQRLSKDDERYLTYISYIGCGVSVMGLLATILTYALFKSLHGDALGQILLNICVSMLLLNLVFLLGSLDSETYGVGICMAVAISLHYLLLTTLLWMMIEALNMYQMLIVVFFERRRWFMRIRLLIGWGIPLGVVALTIAISSDNYKPNKQFCFLSYTNRYAFIAAVMVPTCIILFVNTYVFIRVSIIVLQNSTRSKDPSGSTSTVSLTQVRGAVSVMIILGVTWIFGPLAIGPAKVVFAYMFTILNSIQGFLVFLFRCLFNNEARASWRYFFTTGKLKHKRGSLRPSSASTWSGSGKYTKKTMKNDSVTTCVSKGSFVSHSISISSSTPSNTRYASIASHDHKANDEDRSQDTKNQPLRGLFLLEVNKVSQISQNSDSIFRSSRYLVSTESSSKGSSRPIVRNMETLGTRSVDTFNSASVASGSSIAVAGSAKGVARRKRKRHGHVTRVNSQGNQPQRQLRGTHSTASAKPE